MMIRKREIETKNVKKPYISPIALGGFSVKGVVITEREICYTGRTVVSMSVGYGEISGEGRTLENAYTDFKRKAISEINLAADALETWSV